MPTEPKYLKNPIPEGATHFSKFYDGHPMDFYRLTGGKWSYWFGFEWRPVVDNEPGSPIFPISEAPR